jgi:DNA-binding NarL/FixJ family response regulator
MSDMSILLVEDDPTDRARIKESLSEKPISQFNLKEAESLQSALSLMSHYEFDVVLLDLDLPDCSGLDTARRVIADYRETAVIVLSDPENKETALQAVRYGAEDYFEKPSLSSAMLYKAINYAIERKRILQEKYDVLSDLVLALEKIEQLESILPICAGCKKIYHEASKRWMSLEKYVRQQTAPKTDSPLCSDCQTEFDGNW